MSITFFIGKSRDDATGVPTLVAGTTVARPFDIRHIWRQTTGRDIGGVYTIGDLEGMDWIYGATSDSIVSVLLATLTPLYDELNPYVWVQILDPYANAAWQYEAVMMEPHVERGAGSTITGFVLPFRHMLRVEA